MDPYLAYAKVIQVRIRTMSTESSIQLVYQLSLLFQSYTLTRFLNFNLERNFVYSIKSLLTENTDCLFSRNPLPQLAIGPKQGKKDVIIMRKGGVLILSLHSVYNIYFFFFLNLAGDRCSVFNSLN